MGWHFLEFLKKTFFNMHVRVERFCIHTMLSQGRRITSNMKAINQSWESIFSNEKLLLTMIEKPDFLERQKTTKITFFIQNCLLLRSLKFCIAQMEPMLPYTLVPMNLLVMHHYSQKSGWINTILSRMAASICSSVRYLNTSASQHEIARDNIYTRSRIPLRNIH